MSGMLAIKSKLKELASRQGFRKYMANTSWLMAERILRMLVLMFVGIYIARYLGMLLAEGGRLFTVTPYLRQ